MAEKVHLFASQRVNRKARTDNEEIFTEKVSLITNQQMSIGKLADFKQLVADMATAGIAISTDKVAIKAKQTMVVDENNNTTALFANGKLNAPFRVASDGSLYSVRGSIGGFKIAEAGIGTKITTEDSPGAMYLSKTGITFQYSSSENGNSHVTATTYSGIAQPLLDIYSYQGNIFEGLQVRIHGRAAVASAAKCGIEADITEGGDNFPYGYDDQYLGDNSVFQTRHYALYAKRGNISADEGWIGGAKYNKLSLTATYTELDMRKNNVWIVANNSTTSEMRLVLPSRLIVNQAIGRPDQNSTNPFCVKVFIVVHRSSRYGFHVNARGISSYYNNENYPYMYDSNGTKFSEHDMSPGDSAEFLLIYDGTEYYAQLTQINK